MDAEGKGKAKAKGSRRAVFVIASLPWLLTTFSASLTAQCLRLSRDYLTRPFSIDTASYLLSAHLCHQFHFLSAQPDGLNKALILKPEFGLKLIPQAHFVIFFQQEKMGKKRKIMAGLGSRDLKYHRGI